MSTLDRNDDLGDVEDLDDLDEMDFVLEKSSDRKLGVFYVIAAILGLISSFIILIDKIKLLEDPSFVPSCSINPIISCGNIMKSEQSHAFGFPNPIIGLIAFPVLMTIGALLISKVQLPRWTWYGLGLGVSAGMAFVVWLMSQALYSIGSLCPYCMVVWATMIPTFALTLGRVLKTGGERTQMLSGYAPIIAVVGYGTIALLVFLRFQSFWVSLI